METYSPRRMRPCSPCRRFQRKGFRFSVRESKEGSPFIDQVAVALTAHAMKGDEERCLAVCMDGYISKPIRTAELIAILEQVVPSRIAP